MDELELLELEARKQFDQVAVLRRRVEELGDKMGTVMSREDLIGMVLLLLAVILACTLLEMLIRPLSGPG